MATDGDDREERQARLERMINEFQEARRRRLGKPNDGAVEPEAETDAKVTSRRHNERATIE